MLCSQAIWRRLSADLESRRSNIELLSALLYPSLTHCHPELRQKMARVVNAVRDSKQSFQLLVDRAHPMQMTDGNIRELFAQPDVLEAARTYDGYRGALRRELQLWEVSQDNKCDAFVGMLLSLFRQCEGLISSQERALALCQCQMWVGEGVVHYEGEPEVVDASELEIQP